MKFTPRPYQQQSVDFLACVEKAGLFLDVGLGKTVCAGSHIRATLDACEVRRWLIVAPPRVCQTVWPRQFKQWDHLQSLRLLELHSLTPQRRELALVRQLRDAEVVLISIDLLPWLVQFYGGQHWPFDGVVFDESSLLKDPSTKRFKQVRKVLDSVSHVMLLTGSAAAQGLLGLWSQVYLLDKGCRLGRTFDAYKTTFFDADYHGYRFTPKPGAQERIEELLRPICLTIRAGDHLAVTEQIDNVVPVVLPPAALREYKTLERKSVLKFTEDERVLAVNGGVLANKLAQIANGYVYLSEQDARAWRVLHDVKMDALRYLVLEASGTPLLVAYQYEADKVRLRENFGGVVEFFDGTPEQIGRWQRKEIPLLAMHPKSGGHGVDGLQGVSVTTVWLSPPWSREQYDQFNGRIMGARQIGQATQGLRGVANVLVAENTVDEVALSALLERGATQEHFLNALKRYVDHVVSRTEASA